MKFCEKNKHETFTLSTYICQQVKDPDVKSVPPQIHICSLENSLNGDEDEFYITHETDRNILRVNWNERRNFKRQNVYNITVTCNDTEFIISKWFEILVTGKFSV